MKFKINIELKLALVLTTLDNLENVKMTVWKVAPIK